MDISRCDDDGAVKLAEKSVKSRRNSNFPSDTLQVMCPLLFFSGFGRILDNTEIACQTLNISSLVEREKLRWSLARSKRNLTRKFDRRIGGFMWSKLSVLNTVKIYLPTLDTATTGIARIGAHTLTNRANIFREIQLLKFKACAMTSLQPSCTVCATCFWPTLHWLFTICPLFWDWKREIKVFEIARSTLHLSATTRRSLAKRHQRRKKLWTHFSYIIFSGSVSMFQFR